METDRDTSDADEGSGGARREEGRREGRSAAEEAAPAGETPLVAEEGVNQGASEMVDEAEGNER